MAKTTPVELIGINEAVSAPNWSKSAKVVINIGVEFASDIVSIMLVSGESGSGAVLEPTGDLVFFKEDPTIAANATSCLATAVDHKKMVGKVTVLSSDWQSDAGGAFAFLQLALQVDQMENLWVAMRLDNAVLDYNSAGGDDQFLEFSCVCQPVKQ